MNYVWRILYYIFKFWDPVKNGFIDIHRKKIEKESNKNEEIIISKSVNINLGGNISTIPCMLWLLFPYIFLDIFNFETGHSNAQDVLYVCSGSGHGFMRTREIPLKRFMPFRLPPPRALELYAFDDYNIILFIHPAVP